MTTLEKIKAEIEQNAYPIVHGVNNREKGMTLYGILQIIDKYAEQEKDAYDEVLDYLKANVDDFPDYHEAIEAVLEMKGGEQMTREEAKTWLNKLYAKADITDEYGDMEDMQPYEEAVNMAIKALEQEPCDDVVSMEAVIEWLKAKDIIKMSSQEKMARKELKALPSVRPQEQTGHWILTIEDWNKWTCSECGYYERTDIHVSLGWKYCPKCGAHMVEPQESEDKE